MADENNDRQEILLGRLQWLVERSKRDFKGNPPSFEPAKTQYSVDKAKAADARARAANVDFKPFWHSQDPLALDATPSRHLRDAALDISTETSAPCTVRCGQAIDPETGMTQIRRALCWSLPPSTSPQGGAQKGHSTSQASQVTADTKDEDVPHTVQVARRAEIDAEQQRRRTDRWKCSSQLDKAVIEQLRSRPSRRTLCVGRQ